MILAKLHDIKSTTHLFLFLYTTNEQFKYKNKNNFNYNSIKNKIFRNKPKQRGEKPVHWKPQNIGKKNKKYK